MEKVNCNICGGDKTTPVFSGADYFKRRSADVFDLVRCVQCGLMYITPRPSQDELRKYYGDSFYNESTGWARKVQRYILRREARSFRHLLSAESHVLEIGCGTGEFLAAFRENFGCRVTGIEPDRYAQSRASGRGVAIVGDLDGLLCRNEKFDLVILKHVIEHLPDPRKSLETIGELLQPSGALYLWLPIAGTLEQKMLGKYWHGYDLPRHLYTFTEPTLEKLLSATGFSVRRVSNDLAPNNWIQSIHNYLSAKNRPKKLVDFFDDEKNSLLLALFFPLNFLLAKARNSGRIKLLAVKKR